MNELLETRKNPEAHWSFQWFGFFFNVWGWAPRRRHDCGRLFTQKLKLNLKKITVTVILKKKETNERAIRILVGLCFETWGWKTFGGRSRPNLSQVLAVNCVTFRHAMVWVWVWVCVCVCLWHCVCSGGPAYVCVLHALIYHDQLSWAGNPLAITSSDGHKT